MTAKRYASLVAAALTALVSCRAPRASVSRDAATAAVPEPFTFGDGDDNLLLSALDDDGRVRTWSRPEEVPDRFRRRVMVVDLSKSPEERRADAFVFFADLTRRNAQGKYVALPMSRYRRPGVDRQRGESAQEPGGRVVVYTAPWCSFCKRAKAYLRAKGVDFVERDVEASASAARELEAKLRRAGVASGGVPVIDIDGELVLGFDRERIDELLARRRRRDAGG